MKTVFKSVGEDFFWRVFRFVIVVALSWVTWMYSYLFYGTVFAMAAKNYPGRKASVVEIWGLNWYSSEATSNVWSPMYNYSCHCLRETISTRSVFIQFFESWGADTSLKVSTRSTSLVSCIAKNWESTLEYHKDHSVPCIVKEWHCKTIDF